MSRYGKTIGIVENLVEKAMYEEGAIVSKALSRRGQEIYRVEIDWKSKVFSFWHYRTETLSYDLLNSRIIGYDGFSGSDRDSLNTVLDYLGHNNNEYFRLKNGAIELTLKESLEV